MAKVEKTMEGLDLRARSLILKLLLCGPERFTLRDVSSLRECLERL